MSGALPSSFIGATRVSSTGSCADPLGPGMRGPGPECYSCPPGFRVTYRSNIDTPGVVSGYYYCSPVETSGEMETITQQVYGGPTWGAFTIGVLGGSLVTYTLTTLLGGR